MSLELKGTFRGAHNNAPIDPNDVTHMILSRDAMKMPNMHGYMLELLTLHPNLETIKVGAHTFNFAEVDTMEGFSPEMRAELDAIYAEYDANADAGTQRSPEEELLLADRIGALHAERDALLSGQTDDADEIRKAEREARRDQQREDYDISTMDASKAQSTGRLANGAGALAQAEEMKRKAEKRQKDNTDIQMQLAAMREQLEDRLVAIDTRLSDIGDMRDGIEDVFANGYEVGEDGQITNEQAENALREYEERTGQTVDRNDEAAVMAALHEQWEEFDRETEELNREAGRIRDFIDNDLAVAEHQARHGNLSPEAYQELHETATNQTDAVNNAGADILDKVEVQQEAGYQAELNSPAEAIQRDASMSLDMFN